MIDYTVEMKQADDDDFTEVATNITDTNYTYTDDISSGSTYQFSVKARNIVGFSN